MKKMLISFLMIIIVAVTFAQQPQGVIMKAAESPVIDGVLDAVWDEAVEYFIDKPFQTDVPTIGQPGETTWRMLWRDHGIYVFLVVADDHWYPSYMTGGFDWEFDKPELWFDVNTILTDGLGAQHGQGHHVVSPAPVEAGIDGTPYTDGNGITWAYKVESNGNYTAEYFIPFSYLRDKNGAIVDKTGIMGFDVTIIDRDPGDSGRRRMVWANVGDIDESWSNMDDIGLLTFDNVEPPVYYEVTFNVDMTGADNFDPDNDIVYVTGTLAGFWSEPGTDPSNQTMTRIGSSMAWTKTFQLEAGYYEYKFFINDGWNNGEWGWAPNRRVFVNADRVVNNIWGINTCDPFSLPLTENFDTANRPHLPTCWHQSGTGSYSVETTYNNIHSLQTHVRIYHHYSSAFLITPELEWPVNGLRIRFKALLADNSMRGDLVIGTLPDPANIGAFEAIREVKVVNKEYPEGESDPWQIIDVYVDDKPVDNHYIAFRIGGDEAYYWSAMFLDDIIIEPIPDCPEPYDLQLTNLTEFSAMVEWDQYGLSDVWDVVIGHPGFDPDTEGTRYENIQVKQFEFSGLQSGTSYQVYAAAHCTPGLSSWSAPVVFATKCSSFTLPYSEDFDQTDMPRLPQCWDAFGVGNYSVKTSQDHFNSPPYSLFMQSFLGAQGVAIAPRIDVPLQELSMGFVARVNDGNYKVEIGIVTDVLSYSSFISFQEIILVPGSDFHQYNIHFADYLGPDGRIAIKYGVPDNWGSIYIDDINIDQLPACFPPNQPVVENISASQADISWNQSITVSAWDLLFGPFGFDPHTQGTLIENIPATAYQLAGLAHSSYYQVYVRSHCTGEMSDWSSPLTFHTLCSPIDIPFAENFDAVFLPNLPLCWGSASFHGHIDVINYQSESPTNSTRLQYWNDGGYAMLITPEINADFSVLVLQFKALLENGPADPWLMVGTLTNTMDPGTFISYEEFELTNRPGDPWHELEVTFNNLTVGATNIAFRLGGRDGAAAWSIAYIDDVSITYKTYTLTYTAGEGGSISGSDSQVVIHGDDGEEVTAVPSANYVFVEWSDGRTDNPRQDTNVTSNVEVTAIFESVQQVPDFYHVENIILADTETDCFNAMITITTGGPGGLFITEPGSVANLIAGHSIVMLDQTHFQAGSHMVARIAPGGPFCGEPDKHMTATDMDDLVVMAANVSEVSKPDIVGIENALLFRVFPNPTPGRFTLEMIATSGNETIKVEVLGLRGERILLDELPGDLTQHQLSLEGQLPGIYFIRVVSGQTIGVERIVKR